MDVAAVVGANIDRVAIAMAQEIEKMELDLAVATVLASLTPVQDRLGEDGTQSVPRFRIGAVHVDHVCVFVCVFALDKKQCYADRSEGCGDQTVITSVPRGYRPPSRRP
jgi:hypothetical protein